MTEAYNYRESDNSAYNECDADSTDIDDEEDYTTENGSDDGLKRLRQKAKKQTAAKSQTEVMKRVNQEGLRHESFLRS